MSVVEGVDPGGPGGLLVFAGGALLESFIDDTVPGALVESVPTLVASLVAGLASASGGVGVDCMDTEAWAGGGAAATSFGGSDAGAGSGAVAGVDSLVATRPEESLANSIR